MTLFFEPDLRKLLGAYLFDKADDYYNKNIDYIEKSWYENIRSHYYNLMTSEVKTELTTLLNKFCQLQKAGMNRSLWNQDYSQREHDVELITLLSKQMSENREIPDQLPESLA